MFGIFHVSILRVCAKEEALGPLIQTTTPEEEYMGLVHLGLLKTEDNYSGNTSAMCCLLWCSCGPVICWAVV